MEGHDGDGHTRAWSRPAVRHGNQTRGNQTREQTRGSSSADVRTDIIISGRAALAVLSWSARTTTPPGRWPG
jgi:hypothetical protein